MTKITSRYNRERHKVTSDLLYYIYESKVNNLAKIYCQFEDYQLGLILLLDIKPVKHTNNKFIHASNKFL